MLRGDSIIELFAIGCVVAGAEEWRPVVNYEGLYEVSSLGRLRTTAGRVLSTRTKNRDGYPIVALTKAKHRKTFTLHSLVCRAFHGSGDALHNEVAHLDGSRDNARADNLQWVGKLENHSHKRLHGTILEGERHPRAKLTAAQARVIRQRAVAGEASAQVALEFGISPRTVGDIASGRLWKCLIPDAGNSVTTSKRN